MKITLQSLILALILSGCSAFTKPYNYDPPLIQKNESLVLVIKIGEDLRKFGIEGDTASACTPYGVCTLYLPELEHPLDSFGWCTYGVLLGRAIFGPRENEGMECAGF